MKNYGIQLYSVRDAMEKDVFDTLKKISQMGYKYVEFAGFFGHSSEDILKMLHETELICSGTHSSWEDLRPSKINQTIAYHKTIGNPNYIVPGADLSTLEKIKDFCNVMNYAKPILAAEGIRLGYHNHAHEFALMPWGSTIHSEIEKRTDIDFEIDTYWAFKAGADPVAVMDRLKNRVRVIHLKDGFKDGRGMPLGNGEAPLGKIIDYASANGITIVVESETLTPSGLGEAQICMDFLNKYDSK